MRRLIATLLGALALAGCPAPLSVVFTNKSGADLSIRLTDAVVAWSEAEALRYGHVPRGGDLKALPLAEYQWLPGSPHLRTGPVLDVIGERGDCRRYLMFRLFGQAEQDGRYPFRDQSTYHMELRDDGLLHLELDDARYNEPPIACPATESSSAGAD